MFKLINALIKSMSLTELGESLSEKFLVLLDAI